MMKMIIADDEPVITVGIKKLVDWDSLGIEIVGSYTDGKAAMEGIITNKPDIALLDISMPGMTGVEILKECHLLGISSRIILISGFQEFEYAKAGIQYGAVDYLLKPVICEELLNAIGKGVSQREQELSHDSMDDRKEKIDDYEGLLSLEEVPYLPSYTELFWQKEDHFQMRKLVRFSVLQFIEEYLEKRNQGIVFIKGDDIVIVWKKMDQKEGRAAAVALREEVKEQLGYPIGLIIGKPVEQMSEIPGGFQRCRSMREYFFFADQMHIPVLLEGERVFPLSEGNAYLFKKREQIIDAIIAQDEEKMEKYFGQFTKALCNMADGKKEDALFYLCSTVRVLDEKFQNLSLRCPDHNETELLQRGRECGNYQELCASFYEILTEYLKELKSLIVSNNNRDFLNAKAYIDSHYDENLTLEVLAGEIHMNSHYFSTFFKKNAGENFKDYLSRVRVQHAVSFLISTDMKNYEIALRVGFRDVRGFTENFQRIYHETPASYRKKAKRKEQS